MSLRLGQPTSEQRNRRVFLRFTPIVNEGTEEGKLSSSLSTTTMTSNTSLVEEQSRNIATNVDSTPKSSMPPLPIPEKIGSKSNTPQGLLSPHKVMKEEAGAMQSPDNIRSPGNRKKKNDESPVRLSTDSLTQQESMHLGTIYTRYASFSPKEGCLVNLLNDVTGAGSVSECDVWLYQLENVLGVPRRELCGGTLGIRPESSESPKQQSYGPRRMLTYGEVLRFATWLKSAHKMRIGPRHASLPSNSTPVKGAGKAADDTPSKTATHSGREVKKLDGIKRPKESAKFNIGSGKGKRDSGPSRLFTPTTGSSEVHMPSIGKRPGSTSVSTTTRGYNLELQSFAELGGGSDGTGTIRLIDLKRMLQSFSIEATFGTCVGRVIDKNNTGCITFEEFLWVLEFGVRGMGPAAAIHDHLAAPLTPQNVVTPPVSTERSPASGNKGRSTKPSPSKKGRLAATLEAIRKSFAAQSEKLSPYLTSLKTERRSRSGRRSPNNLRKDRRKLSISPCRGLLTRSTPGRRCSSRKKSRGRSPTNRGTGKRLHTARKDVALGA
ncbi:uncharacterized protein TEOVI_000199100 [Trypanosoma equiperdum]|uniref:EF-hand domain-containing protein n=2 Tax=Trypanozoon TaxID=39700 RepID=Q38AU8_TRYB2|nr:hypothetical protein Tb10.70.0200 [Trypanosoma brucei brucei TREU927]EAN78072.1 hypothetical protein Tb10.70.0200 [Trypanosoma brucei brucei TREU927]SCU70418.1 hypothetical protein, conserved [Trypanosoma equiperdum]